MPGPIPLTHLPGWGILPFVSLSYDDLVQMRRHNPSWRLMAADYAPLVTSFLDRVFREDNRRELPQSQLVMRLEDYLFELRRTHGEVEFPRTATEYLNDWAQDERGWLRKFYPLGSDEAHFDLTPATEKALQWLETLFERGFIGTESRLVTVFRILQEIVEGVEEDKAVRIKRLKERRREIDQEIKAVERGDVPVLDAREIRERFDQFSRMSRELLSDFRAVQHNFRELDRSVRERIANWSGEKSRLLEEIFGEHDAITGSDQGASFRAFWDFLMSPTSQEEFTRLLDRLYELEDLEDAKNDLRLKRIHFDWMSAGEKTQRTVARLSRQLRSFLDDRAFYENRRLIQLMDGIEQKAHAAKERIPTGDFMEIDGIKAEVILPLDRSLFSPPVEVDLRSVIEEMNEETVDTAALFDQIVVDRARLMENIARGLSDSDRTTLKEVIERDPLEEGLAELIVYFTLASTDDHAVIDADRIDNVTWTDRSGIQRRAAVPRLTFYRRRRTDG